MFQPYLRNQNNFAGATGEVTGEVFAECSWNTIITVCMSNTHSSIFAMEKEQLIITLVSFHIAV